MENSDSPSIVNSNVVTFACATNSHLFCIAHEKGECMHAPFKIGPMAGAIVILVGCGSSNSMIRVSPAFAEAKNYAGGVVPFTATGASNLTWCIGSMNGVCNGNVASSAVIDATGHAQCIQGQSGTVTVLAGTGGRVGIPDAGEQLSSFGTAQLTCP